MAAAQRLKIEQILWNISASWKMMPRCCTGCMARLSSENSRLGCRFYYCWYLYCPSILPNDRKFSSYCFLLLPSASFFISVPPMSSRTDNAEKIDQGEKTKTHESVPILFNEASGRQNIAPSHFLGQETPLTSRNRPTGAEPSPSVTPCGQKKNPIGSWRIRATVEWISLCMFNAANRVSVAS